MQIYKILKRAHTFRKVLSKGGRMNKRNPLIVLAIGLIDLIVTILLINLTNQTVVKILFWSVLPIIGYYIWLQMMFQSGLRRATGKGEDAAGHIWSVLLTFGGYYIYWCYAAGKRLKLMGAKDRSVIYLIFGTIGYLVSTAYTVLVLIPIISVGQFLVLDVIFLVCGIIPYVMLAHMKYAANKTFKTPTPFQVYVNDYREVDLTETPKDAETAQPTQPAEE
jgi:hypothetical protein